MKKIVLIAFFINCIFSIFAQIPTNGLVAWYPFNVNAHDSSGNVNNGTVNGATLTSDRFGNANSAYYFNGSSSIYNDNVSLRSVFDNNNSYSINFWFNTGIYNNKSMTNMQLFACDGNNVFPYKRTWIAIYQSDTMTILHFSRYNANTMGCCTDVQVELIPSSILTLNSWHFLSANYDGNDVYIYLDGNKLLKYYSKFNWYTGYIGHNITMDGNDSETIGTNFGNNNQKNTTSYSGKLDDIRIYNRALDSVEIQSLSNEGICFKTVYDTIKITKTINDTIKITKNIYDTIKITKTIIDTLKITVHDTIKITKTINDTIKTSVEDTLKINVIITSTNPQIQVNQIKVYPNPTGNILNINTGNYSEMKNYQLKIINTKGQIVWSTIVSQQIYTIDLSLFGGAGLYYLHIFDEKGNLIEVKKIVLLKYITET